ncbi:MAG: peptide chain release factor 1 [Fimbriimonadaceae bacterium]|nr:Peptide chain release factor 1 [Fimbriimonadaceae bacterium]MCL4283587.1 peptide chain release factor 1 [Fimbriimonadaceae bacterium]QOJ11334.1 MAG: peptide chain release factor 1 [Chthonomonadaceae bacterium]
MLDKLAAIEERYDQIEGQLQDPDVVQDPSALQRLGKERASLEEIVGVIKEYRKCLEDLADAESLLSDEEMRDLAQAEIQHLKVRSEELEHNLKLKLLATDPNDDKSVIIEIRQAAGGQEAALFAGELFRMYTRYAERRKWKYDLIEMEESDLGGVSRVVFSIDAVGAYSQLKHESGVHRVQRVPATESGGRIHTSTITVAVLPAVEDVEVEIRSDDLEVSTFRSSSAGGQHMQKNETAIRIVHKPTGIAVTCQDERSQQQNRLKAMEVLRAKLYQLEQERLDRERGALRKGQIGSGDRSEKIRTYNFPQQRITDHRIGLSVHNTTEFMDGAIQEMIDALNQAEQAAKLAALDDSAVGAGRA